MLDHVQIVTRGSYSTLSGPVKDVLGKRAISHVGPSQG